MSTARIVRRLDELLEQQADCLRNGDISGAFAVSPAIEKLVEHLETATQPDPSVAGLRGQAARNAGLIEAAQKGVAAARSLLAESVPQDGFQSYDAQGRATVISGGR